MSDSRPNIIMIMTDQQRFDALGCVNPVVRTPGIDSLAARGILFGQAVTQCPMCVPARNSLMFGLYPSQTGVRTNGGALLDESRLPSVPLPQRLHDAGYFCAGFGKTHWNNTRKGGQGSRRGFDVRAEGQPRNSVLCEEGAVMMDDEDPEGLRAYFDETREYGSGEENALGYMGKISRLPKEHHRDGFIWRKCMEFLDSYTPGDRPLFLYFSLIKPHAGFNVPQEFEDMYRLSDIPDLPAPPWTEEPDTHIRAAMKVSPNLYNAHYGRKSTLDLLDAEERRLVRLRYYANCSFMDWFIARVLEKIHEKRLDENALIVFLSDHGDMMGERDGRYSKYCLYEASVRVPLILAGDFVGRARWGARDERPAELTDIVPTLMNAAGIAKDPQLPGADLLGEFDRSGAFSEFHGGGGEDRQLAPAWMWRNADYKLILFRDGTINDSTPLRGELYALKDDPYEWHNLFYDPAFSAVRAQMTLELIKRVSTAFAKAPAHGDYRGTDRLK